MSRAANIIMLDGSSPRRHRAMSLAEVLVSLAITSMLLTAIAAAFSSSASIVENNDRFARASQAARVALNQMLAEIRRSDTIQAQSLQIDIIRPDQHRPANEKMRSYRYDPTGKKLLLFFTYIDGSTSPNFTLAENVASSVPFTWEMGTDANNTACVSRVSIDLDVRVGSSDIRFSGSAAPRRNLTYN